MTAKDPDDLSFRPLSYRLRDACRVTGMKKTKLNGLISDGTLKSVKVGRCRLIPADALEELLKGAK